MTKTYLEIAIVLQLQDKVAELCTKKLDYMEDGCEVCGKPVRQTCEQELIAPQCTQGEFHAFETPKEAEGLQVEETAVRGEYSGERTVNCVAQGEDVPAAVTLNGNIAQLHNHYPLLEAHRRCKT